MLSHILGVSLPPSACSNPLCRHPPPSSEGGKGAPVPCAELMHCGKEDSNERNPSGVRFSSSRLCSAKARRGRSRAEHGITKVQSAVKPAFGGLPSSVTVQRSAQHRATFPKGKALRSRGARRICSLRGQRAEVCAQYAAKC